jgi:cob(I)alamin adenosyltransferase
MTTKKINKNKPVVAKKGLVICYIGDGKGKTSAAMGLVSRASGAGFNVFVLQFVKARAPKDGEKRQSGEWPLSSEIEFFNNVSEKLDSRFRGNDIKLGKIETDQVGVGFVGILGDKKERDQHIREAVKGLELTRKLIMSKQWQVLVLDEILSAVELNLLTEQDILDIIKLKPDDLHLVLTGHNKFPAIIKACDLVTEMKMIKHPYYENVLAQRGIDY